jgi:lauroyl/myristoyl acyltransferase
MDLHVIINSAFGVGLALTIGRLIPKKVGYLLADWVAIWIARRDSNQVNAVRTNQWIISGKQKNAAELDHQVKLVFRRAAKSLFDFYHIMQQSEKLLRLVEIKPEINEYFDPKTKKNAMFVAPHISNFEIVGRALGLRGYRFQILSYPTPGSGYQMQNKYRTDVGHYVTPTTIESLHTAQKRLKNGENVLTGLDRPIASAKYKPEFFGFPASVPVAYTRLALEAKVPVILVSAISKTDGSYLLYSSEPIEMKSDQDLYKETIRNVESVLRVGEDLIAKYPDQWSMYYPVWPEFLSQTPRSRRQKKGDS